VDRVARLVRRHPVVRRTAAGLVDKLIAALPPGAPMGLRAGRAFGPGEGDDLPVVLVACLGPDDDALARAVRELATVQLSIGGFRPVLVTDAAGFAAVRRAGYAVEHLIAPSDWAARDGTASWSDYAVARLARLRADYGNASLISMPASGSDRELLAALLLDASSQARGRGPSATIARMAERLQHAFERSA
jgi:hypothetical protein